MSVPEVLWRVRGAVRDSVDRLAVGGRSQLPSLSRIMNGSGSAGLMRSAVLGEHFPGMGSASLSDVPEVWRLDAVRRAQAASEHVLSIFDLQDHPLGNPIDWNYEYKAKQRAPMGFAGDVDYRDYAVTGDCKFVWEPSRHHQLVTLGRGYRYTGDERYARAVLEQIDSWIDQCPYGMGMNWRSPLELAIRLINWVWTLELIRSSTALTTDRVERIVAAAYLHLRDISRKYSRYSSANNHLIGEAAGVYIGSSYFGGLKNATRWRRQSREILLREIVAQTHADGGNREQAMGYHLFVLQFFLLAGLAGRNQGDDFGSEYWGYLEKQFDFVSAFIDGEAVSPMFGDSDDGYVLDLGRSLGDPRSLMAIGAVLFDRSDLRSVAGEFAEPAYWLLGTEGRSRFEELKSNGVPSRQCSRAFPQSGRYVLRRGRCGDQNGVTVAFDCGELGFGSIAAHGHADALSFTLRAGGRDVLVDPGTYDYFTYPRWRDYFRSTRAHNTIVIDDADQSEMLGPFLWGRRAVTRCLRWEPSEEGGTVAGEHDGYQRLADPVTHRRSVVLQGNPAEVVVNDEIVTKGRHEVATYLHLGEQCSVLPAGENGYVVDYGAGRATIEMDRSLSVSVVNGSEDPGPGWVSRGYHQKLPTTTLVGRCQCQGELSLVTRISIEERQQ